MSQETRIRRRLEDVRKTIGEVEDARATAIDEGGGRGLTAVATCNRQLMILRAEVQDLLDRLELTMEDDAPEDEQETIDRAVADLVHMAKSRPAMFDALVTGCAEAGIAPAFWRSLPAPLRVVEG